MRTWMLGLCMAGAVGCGGGGGLPIEDLDTAVADAYCDYFVRCGVITNRDACAALFDFNVTELQHAVEMGLVVYDEGKARECLDAISSRVCDQSSEEARVEPAACNEAIVGTVVDGGACTVDEVCLSRTCNTSACTMACCAGTCDPTVIAAQIGSPCPTGDCVDGAYCATGGMCQALISAGTMCMGTFQCDYGLYCAGNPNTCQDAPNHGDACPFGVCADAGDRCDGGTAMCISLSDVGGACTATGGGCKFPLDCNMATLMCENPPGIGVTCTGACADGAWCDAGTCAAVKPNGQPCGGPDECSSGYCDGFATMPVCAADPVCI